MAIGKIEKEDIGNIWFQQDGATCHTAKATLDVLCPVFEDRIIRRRAGVVWPPRSCDLTPLDYYLWGAIKDKCYADKPEIIDALKDNIREAIGEIHLHTIGNALQNWTRSCRLLHGQPRQRCMDIAQQMLMTFNDDLDLLKRVITGSKSFQISLTTFILIFYTKLITVSMIHFFFFGE